MTNPEWESPVVEEMPTEAPMRAIDDDVSADQDADPSVSEAEEKVRQSRREVRESVEALAEKLDVKDRTRRRLGDVKDRVTDWASHARQDVKDRVDEAKYSTDGHAGMTGTRWAVVVLAVGVATVAVIVVRAVRR